jgi:hypothetical protein
MSNAETRYGFEIYPWWNNLNDRVAYMREFSVPDGERQRIAQAMISQDPLTPRSEIRDNMTFHGTPAKYGYDDSPATIARVLDNDLGSHIDDSAWNDFSGGNGETNATQRPYNAVW